MAQKYGNRWTIIESLTERGQGLIFKVKDSRDNSTGWILKRLKNPDRLGRFEREIEALRKLDCPHIAKPVDYSTEGKAFIVFRDLGEDLSCFATLTKLETRQILLLFRQIVMAVCASHNAGVIHRDIKPDNVIISHDGSTAYLIDFGICQYLDSSLTLLTSDEAFGNSAFAAPECFLGREDEPSFPCDIYSLGKVLYWMISGEKYILRENITPYVIKNIKAKNSLIRFYLTRLIRGTIIEEPLNRWSAEHLLDEIDTTLKLINRETKFLENGQVVIEDNFGVDDTFYRSGSKSITKSPRGNPPGDYDLGIGFEINTDYDLKLDSISLALSNCAGTGEVEINIVESSNDEPSSNGNLETFTLIAPAIPTALTLESLTKPILKKGNRYWITLFAIGKGTEVAVWSAPIEFVPRKTLIARRGNYERWKIVEAAPGYAFRVTGRPVLSSS